MIRNLLTGAATLVLTGAVAMTFAQNPPLAASQRQGTATTQRTQPTNRSGAAAAAAAAAKPQAATGEPGKPMAVRIMTYNVENWRYSFLAFKVSKTTQPSWDADALDLIQRERREDDEENWEVARTIEAVKPDVWVLQEGCDASDLNYFNTQFLSGYFDTVHIFKTNSERGQNTAILVRGGFKVLEFREQYHQEPETDDVNPVFDKLFARGPGFALIQAPNGTKFWVGTNHAKSKSDNSVEVTRWRNAEARRTNAIINELRKTGPREVFFLGDMNDELGVQEYEQEAGGSAIELLAGKGNESLTVLTKKLSDGGAISFHGGRRSRYRSFIDHAFATPEAARWVKDVKVFTGDVADVASDHYPVVVETMVP